MGEYSRRRLLLASFVGGLTTAAAGCTELSGEQVEEPDEPPAGIRDGVDLERLRKNTEQALATATVEVAGRHTEFEDADDETSVSRSEAIGARGDADREIARYVTGTNRTEEVTEDPDDADRVIDRYYDGGEVFERRESGDTPDYSRDDASYEDFVRRLERGLEHFYEAGTYFEFDDPAWDGGVGAYAIEAVAVDDAAVEIDACTIHVDGDGVVVGIAAELITEDGGAVRTDVGGTPGADVNPNEPEWIDEATGQLPVWTYRAGERPTSTIVDDVCYVASRDGMAALDRSDGTERWTFEPEGTLWAENVTGESAYVTDGNGNVSMLSADDGDLLWSTRVEEANPSPAVDGDAVYVLANEHVYRIDPADGSELWHTAFETRTIGLVIEDDLYIGTLNGDVYALNPADGTVNWSFKPRTRSWVTPQSLRNGTLYLNSFDGDVYALDPANGTGRWRFRGSDMVYRLRADSERLYATIRDDGLYAIDPADGDVLWEFEPQEPGTTVPTPAGSTVYVCGSDGTLSALSADDGSPDWTFETGGQIENVTVEDEVLYVGSRDEQLYAVNQSDGTERWAVETNYWVRSKPIVVDDTLYATDVGRGGGIVYAFDVAAMEEFG